MHFAKFIPLAFAATAIAAPKVQLEKRNLATIQAAFASVTAAVQTLDNGIKGVTAGQAPQTIINTLTSQSSAVTDALNAGTASVTPTSSLSLGDALSLLSSTQTLVNNVDTTVNDLIGKKPIIDGANASSNVIAELQNQKTASQTFIAAVVSKVPSAAQGIANQQASQVITILNNGITAFGGSAS